MHRSNPQYILALGDQLLHVVASLPAMQLEWKSDLPELKSDFRKHGFCCLSPIVPTDVTSALQHDAELAAMASLDFQSRGNRGIGRVCLNRDNNIEYDSWWNALKFLCDPAELPCQLMTKLFGDAWWFDRSGGDVVQAGAGFDQPCVPHSDW